MPRIVPLQLLTCLKVLLDDNGGILNSGRVKRLASLMTKFSKKLVSKCIYVQILKCTKTELLGEFMGTGGWSLVYTWLNDAIRAMNWPFVQEILELLLLCPVDVHRLKINSAPKLVKCLCKDGGNEGVRILAKRLVEQWLKVVTENPEATLSTGSMIPQAPVVKTPTVAVVAPEAIPVNVQQQQASVVNSSNQNTSSVRAQQQQLELQQKTQQKPQEEQKPKIDQQKLKSNKKPNKVQEAEPEEEVEEEEENHKEKEENTRESEVVGDQDPLGGVDPEPIVSNYSLTPAQKKASESGLVYKFIIKDGQSILAKVPSKSTKPITASPTQSQPSVEEEEDEAESNEVIDEEAEDSEVQEDTFNNSISVAEADENSSSLDKTEKDNDSGSEEKPKTDETKKPEDKKLNEDVEKSGGQNDRRSSKDKERRVSSSSIEKDKDKDSKTSKSSSSSTSHRSSSHKSSSLSSRSSSSSNKSKSSSSHRSDKDRPSSSDKHRSDKERSSSSKDKDRSSGSSSSSKHRSSSSSSSSKTSSSSSSSKDKYRDKEKTSSSSSSSKGKEKQEQSQTEKDKSTLEKVISSSSSLDKLGKIPKKPKEDLGASNDSEGPIKPTSITIPSKKASMSIEIRRDTEKAKTVKTYKSQFRSHGLTEEAPPPPSRKGLKKPSSVTPPGTVLPSSLPSSLKRSSPPPKDSPSEKKAKIDINNVTIANEKPGAIKLIPPKKIQTLVETNLFSDALSAATGPKKITKRKRPNTPLVNGKEGPPTPTSPEASKVAPLKFYQDTLDESKTEDSKTNKENDETAGKQVSKEAVLADDKDIEDDDDIPLKKVKEDIEQKVAKEKKLERVDIDETSKDGDELKQTATAENVSSPGQQDAPNPDEEVEIVIEKKPGPGCGPNGPPGVLMLHRRKGPKKKLTWRPQESLEQIRYFELDENERCNVTKTSFMDMKNMEHFNERDAIVMARRGFNHEDNMDIQTHWKPLIEVDDVPPHPEGNQSKQRKIQAERELTTLRALYFTHAIIPDSPAEADFEPVFNHDVPLIPLDDLTGNPDAVNDFTSMPWPEPRGSPKQGDNSLSGTGGLGSPVNMFGSPTTPVNNASNNNNKAGANNSYNPFVNTFASNQTPSGPNGPVMQNSPQNQWQGPGNVMPGPMGGNGPIMGNSFNGSHGSPIMDMAGPGPMMNNGPPQNFMNQFPTNFGGPFMGGPQGFNNGPNNFGPMGPNGPMINGMGPGPMGNNFPPMMNGGHNNRNNRGNNGGNWRSGGSNFQDNSGGGGNWRPAGPGLNMRGGGMNNNGVCKAFMRGHCRLGNSCKYIHPNKSKRI